MITNVLGEMSGWSRPSAVARQSRVSVSRPRHEVLAEQFFRKLLSWERKRAERSSRFFVLMLARVESILREDPSERALAEMVAALSDCKRETDVSGWYRHGRVLGVIFTELGEESPEAFTRLTRARLMESLEGKLLPEKLNQVHISFHVFPAQTDKLGVRQPGKAGVHPDLIEEDRPASLFRAVKRIMDIAGSVAAMVLCSPLLVAIAVAIKITSKGPILFKQERIGQHGLPFTFLKFRSMKCGNNPGIHRAYVKQFIAGKVGPNEAGNGGNGVFKIQNDPRVTAVGRFLRKSSLDELPQLINVLRGEMSLVGPRPAIPYEVEEYQAWHRRRIFVKPGITGLWQVNGRSRTTFDDMVRLDLQYAKTWSPWLDLKILLQTPVAVFSGEGAY